MKRILINATQAEEFRVAMIDGQYLYDLDIEPFENKQKKSNIYKGKIEHIRHNLEAAFVNYGEERHGFLPLKDLYRSYNKDQVQCGQEILVQVDKDERGTKGAALTTQISIPGRFLVLMPNKPNSSGISRRMAEEERNQIQEELGKLTIPEGMSVIARTASINRHFEDFKSDLEYLMNLWRLIDDAAKTHPTPALIYKENNVVIRALRDYMREDIAEVLIDDPQVFKQAQDFVRQVMPSFLDKLKLYNDPVHLFSRYQIEEQIESAYKRNIRLRSGASIVIDHTEALTSIDVNSSSSKKGKDIEEMALKINMEAATEIVRQIKIRDLGGLIVIDFIDMEIRNNRKRLEGHMQKLLKDDRARVQIEAISKFGLLEMSRQRIRSSLRESSQIVCPRCNGQGSIRDIESLSLSILRLIAEEAIKENTIQIHTKVPIEIAAFLLNEKRQFLSSIEQNANIKVIVIPNPHMETPEFKVQRIKDKNFAKESHHLIPKPEEISVAKIITPEVLKKYPKPAVDQGMHIKRYRGRNPLRRIWSFLMGHEYWNDYRQ